MDLLHHKIVTILCGEAIPLRSKPQRLQSINTGLDLSPNCNIDVVIDWLVEGVLRREFYGLHVKGGFSRTKARNSLSMPLDKDKNNILEFSKL